MTFKDHFSGHAEQYARHRPTYGDQLYDWLAGLTSVHELAWDCATGNGQAAVGLARHYRAVLATDASAEQIAHHQPHPRVTYRIEPAEASSCADATVDLVTVAQALHWLDLDKFYAVVRRVLKPGGVLATWGYGLATITPEVDRVVANYYDEVRDYWPPERLFVEQCYRALPFPFPKLSAPVLAMEADWALDDLVAYIQTWSATRRATQALGKELWIVPLLQHAWGEPSQLRRVTWPLFFRVGRI